MRFGAQRKDPAAGRLRLTAFDLADGTRIRDAVARTVVAVLADHEMRPGPELRRTLILVQADLADFLRRAGVPGAEAEAAVILADVMRAIAAEVLRGYV